MTDQQLHLRVSDPSRVSGSQERAPSIVRQIAGSQMTSPPLPRSGTRAWVAIVVIVLAVGAASAWTFVARDQLRSAVLEEASHHLVSARKAFDALRAQTRTGLSVSCRVLVEDPRLKSTLATEGMDAATVADILQDLGKLRQGGFLLVLAPDGRVFAQSGASELEDLDLSASAFVKKARDAADATVGSWAIAGKVMDLSIKSIRYGDTLVAFLVVGQSVDDTLLAAVEDQTDVAVASVLASKVVMTSTKDLVMTDVLVRVAGETTTATPHVVSHHGARYIASSAELPETAQAHRLVLASPLATVEERFRVLEWMVFAPPALVLFAVLLVLATLRSPRRIT